MSKTQHNQTILVLIVLCLLLLSTKIFANDKYLLQPGDILEISVWKEPDLQSEVLVQPDGRISFPLVGSVMAKGRTVQAVNSAIAARLENIYLTQWLR